MELIIKDAKSSTRKEDHKKLSICKRSKRGHGNTKKMNRELLGSGRCVTNTSPQQPRYAENE